MIQKTFTSLILFLAVFSFAGCGPDTSVTVSPVDDSVLHSAEDEAAMEAEMEAEMAGAGGASQ